MGSVLSLLLLNVAEGLVFIGLLMLGIGVIYLCIDGINRNWNRDWDEVYMAITVGIALMGAILFLLSFAV